MASGFPLSLSWLKVLYLPMVTDGRVSVSPALLILQVVFIIIIPEDN